MTTAAQCKRCKADNAPDDLRRGFCLQCLAFDKRYLRWSRRGIDVKQRDAEVAEAAKKKASGLRRCGTCHEYQELSNFYWGEIDPKKARSDKCLPCRRAYQRSRYAKFGRTDQQRKIATAWNARRRRCRIGWCKCSLSLLKYKARKYGIKFNLTLQDLLDVFPEDEVCPVFKVKFILGCGRTKNMAHYSPSVDRIRPELGYVKGNIAIISKRANQIKQDASAAEIVAVGKWLRAIEDQGLCSG